jgi:hypothetical protein
MDEHNMHEPGADRTGSDRFKQEDDRDSDLRNANENIRKAQGDDAADTSVDEHAGNKPRIDRDR